jgi:hypothetical protein
VIDPRVTTAREVRFAFFESWARFLLSIAMIACGAWCIFGRIGLGIVLALFGAVLMASLSLARKAVTK